jgi:hypothetical protein
MINRKRKNREVNNTTRTTNPVASPSHKRSRNNQDTDWEVPPSPTGVSAARPNLRGRKPKGTKSVSPTDLPRTPQKKGRGRPKKHVVTEVDNSGDVEVPKSFEPIPEDEGISEILLPKTPVRLRVDNGPQLGDDVEEQPEHGSDVEGISSDEEEDLDEHGPPQPELYAFDVDPLHIVEELIEISNLVGCKKPKDWKMGEKAEVKIKFPSSGKSSVGKEFVKKLADLSKRYQDLGNAASKDKHIGVHRAYAKTTACVEKLAGIMDTIMVDDAEDSSVPGPIGKKFLMDVYFIVLPQWLKCIRLAIEARSEEGGMSSLSLQEVSRLVRLCRNILNSALVQTSQPGVTDVCSVISKKKEAPKISGLTFQIRQPATTIRKRLQTLINQFRRGINTLERRAQGEQDATSAQSHEEAEEAASSARYEAKQVATRIALEEREKGRIAALERLAEKNKRHKEIIHQRQREDWKRIRLELDTMWPNGRNSHKQRSASTKPSRVAQSSPSDLEDINDPFSENYQVVAGVFPANNRRQTKRVALTKEEEEAFIVIMMRGDAGM